MYDFLYNAAEIVLNKHNPCGFDTETGECRMGATNGCCTGCPHLTGDGCTVKSLMCKLWLCNEHSEAYDELYSIRVLAHEAGLIPMDDTWKYARLSKDEFFACKRGEDVHSNRPDIFWRA